MHGGAGDINPLFQARSGKEDADFSVMKKVGELLAAEVVRRIDGGKASIESKGEVLTFADRWEKDKSLNVGITTVLTNKEIAIRYSSRRGDAPFSASVEGTVGCSIRAVLWLHL